MNRAYSSPFRLGVVIPTYNRASVLGRAIQSVLSLNKDIEVIVVDDASTDGTQVMIEQCFPSVQYYRLPHNMGPGAARNLGLAKATSPIVIMLDSDDEFTSDAYTKIMVRYEALVNSGKSVGFFRTTASRSSVEQPIIVQPTGYFQVVQGDWAPVIVRNRFIEKGYRYPSCRVGGEGILWLEVSRDYEMIAYPEMIIRVNSDDPDRLTSPESRIKNCLALADYHREYILRHGDFLRIQFPKVYRSKLLAAAVYNLLASNRKGAWDMVRNGIGGFWHPCLVVAGILMVTPTKLLRWLFEVRNRLGPA